MFCFQIFLPASRTDCCILCFLASTIITSNNQSSNQSQAGGALNLPCLVLVVSSSVVRRPGDALGFYSKKHLKIQVKYTSSILIFCTYPPPLRPVSHEMKFNTSMYVYTAKTVPGNMNRPDMILIQVLVVVLSRTCPLIIKSVAKLFLITMIMFVKAKIPYDVQYRKHSTKNSDSVLFRFCLPPIRGSVAKKVMFIVRTGET